MTWCTRHHADSRGMHGALEAYLRVLRSRVWAADNRIDSHTAAVPTAGEFADGIFRRTCVDRQVRAA